MAVMYPKNIELYDSTLSEKKVYKALQTQLPNNYTVFYSVKWVDEINGVKKESECDFLIFSENEGFLTCEVKGGRGFKKVNNKFVLEENDGERELKRSPMEQAEESSRYFYKLYSNEYNDSFNGIYGSISLFPFYQVNDIVLMDHRTKDVVLDIDDMNNLYQKIRKAFAFYKSCRYSYGSLTKNQKINFKNMINKKIASQASAGAIIEAKEFEINSVNRIQDNFVYFLSNYNRTFISGGAGTGKTWIAYKFAKKASLEGKNVLITMSSKHLTSLYKSLLSNYGNISILSFEEMVINEEVDINQTSDKIFGGYDSASYKKFDSIIVDEAQDFDQYQAMVISLHLKDSNSEFRVFFDKTQNVLDKDFKDGFDITIPPFLLRENLRNTSSIYDWATEKTNLGKDVITNQIIGPTPISYKFSKQYDLKRELELEILKLVDYEGVPIESIVVLVDHDNFDLNNQPLGRWILSNNVGKNCIRLSLVEDFKGLESNIVFYVHNVVAPEKYNYVAYTRAKYYLYEYILKK